MVVGLREMSWHCDTERVPQTGASNAEVIGADDGTDLELGWAF